MKQYEKKLNQDQKRNADNFNKVYQPNKSDDPFENFFQNNLNFDNWNSWNWEEKDW